MPLIPAFERQGQEELCEFDASLVSIVNSRPTSTTESTTLSPTTTKSPYGAGCLPQLISIITMRGRQRQAGLCEAKVEE